ncbi:hypothetical protein EDD21DRAFT_385093 [Dissophora ornata]|nr:hypothetical protein EDD21DRAFT_385093 [Dissophora ornata]
MSDLSDFFTEASPKNTIHVAVQPSSIDRRSGNNKRPSVHASSSDSANPNKKIATGSLQGKLDNSPSGSSEGNDYLDESAFAVLLDRVRNELHVKCHYKEDTRVILVRENISFRKLAQRIQEKFQLNQPLKFQYGDRMSRVSMVDDEDWLLAQETHKEYLREWDEGCEGEKKREIELCCYDIDDNKMSMFY